MSTQPPPIPQSGRPDVPHGVDLMNRPVLNKGTAFTEDERGKFGLHGLLPPHIESLDEQAVRAYEAYKRKDDDLEGHAHLRALQDTNTEAITREMARKVQRPIIFPLSNPTAMSEATADDLIRWTDGRALVATGSPFAPVSYEARRIPIAQCNSIYIFPATGLGVVASGARGVTDTMILAAARALAENSPALKDASASLLSALTDLRQVAVQIAIAVGQEARNADIAPMGTEDELRQRVISTQRTPAYPAPG
jgi:Malic enzyme, NAD binding domain